MKPSLILASIAALGALAFFYFVAPGPTKTVTSTGNDKTALADVVLPATLSTNAQTGKTTYEASCSACHGPNAAGQDGVAPPLIHVIYEPSHHADESFQRAVVYGVQAHHWPFGNMPAVKGLTRDDVTMIITYIRELQRANGIN
jgi:mono/diheme cytochrome c family protein